MCCASLDHQCQGSASLVTKRQYPAGAPVFVPWKDHAGEPRFLCDVMTEGLAKQLRLYGVDAAAVESKGRGSRHLVYRSASYYCMVHVLKHCCCTAMACARALSDALLGWHPRLQI